MSFNHRFERWSDAVAEFNMGTEDFLSSASVAKRSTMSTGAALSYILERHSQLVLVSQTVNDTPSVTVLSALTDGVANNDGTWTITLTPERRSYT